MSINELIELLTEIKEQIGGEQSVFFSDNCTCEPKELGNVYVEHDVADGQAYCVITEAW